MVSHYVIVRATGGVPDGWIARTPAGELWVTDVADEAVRLLKGDTVHFVARLNHPSGEMRTAEDVIFFGVKLPGPIPESTQPR